MEKKTVIRHIRGNYIEIRVPLSCLTLTSIDGNVDRETGPFRPSKIVVRLWKGGIARYDLAPTISDNMLIFRDYGQIALGTYDIEILSEDQDFRPALPMRFKKQAFLYVADCTGDGGEFDTNEFNVIAYYPVIEGREHAIVIDGDKVYIEVGGHFGADDDPTDNKATIFTGYGEGQIVLENNKVILEI